ncbi:MAG: ABC transporter ATP-binding protein/permease, partial [Defluviitaleaceae bacterium]|nr:ABC transporter ATP-binding protein/permease [Defluviitaleaceae bacterium]
MKSSYGFKWIAKKTKGMRLCLFLFTVLILIATMIELSMAFFIKLFVDTATGDADAPLLTVGLAALALIAAGSVFFVFASVLSKYIYGTTERRLRADLLDAIFSRRMADISRRHTGDLMTKLTVDVQSVSECFPNILTNMVGGLASAVVATVAMFLLDWRMALIMLIMTPLLMVVMGVLTPPIKKTSEIDKKNEEANRSYMQESLSRIVLVKAYFMHKKIVERVKEIYAPKIKSGMRLGMWEGLAQFLGTIVSMSMFLIALGVGAYFVMHTDTTVGSLIAIVQLLNYVVNPITRFAETVAKVSQSAASADRIGAVLDLPADEGVSRRENVDAKILIAENVSFAYETESGETKNVFENVSASFEKGKVTGLAGVSGSGKSTLLKLLVGLFAPS